MCKKEMDRVALNGDSILSNNLDNLGMANKEGVSNDSNLYKITKSEGEIRTLMELTKGNINPFDENIKIYRFNNSTGKAADNKTFLLNGMQKEESERNIFLKKSVENPSNGKIFTPLLQREGVEK